MSSESVVRVFGETVSEARCSVRDARFDSRDLHPVHHEEAGDLHDLVLSADHVRTFMLFGLRVGSRLKQ